MNYITPNWPAPPQIKAFTTTRLSWSGRYAEKSPSLVNLFTLPEEPIWVKQTHSTIVLPATPENKDQVADATYTSEVNRVCVILTADCLPLLICNKKSTQVAAIHAGWRGLSAGIIENTLAALQQPPDDLLVWLGPAIGPQKFEVGQDVYDAFTQIYPHSTQAFKPHSQGKWLANLYELAKIRLISAGISNIFGGNYCTHSEADLFFSYRRDQGQTGRMASVIWRTK